jgi:hypothetical protein
MKFTTRIVTFHNLHLFAACSIYILHYISVMHEAFTYCTIICYMYHLTIVTFHTTHLHTACNFHILHTWHFRDACHMIILHIAKFYATCNILQSSPFTRHIYLLHGTFTFYPLRISMLQLHTAIFYATCNILLFQCYSLASNSRTLVRCFICVFVCHY